MTGEVRLRVPADPDFFRVVRLITSGVANTRGFALDGLEDLRIAVHELCGALVGGGLPGIVALRFVMLPDGIRVEGERIFADAVAPVPALSPLSTQILDVVVDQFELDGARFSMTKRLGGSS